MEWLKDMKLLLKNGTVVNVFTEECIPADVLIEGERIIGVGRYDASDADELRDVSGKYICPGLIDGHIHIESSMLTPAEFARVSVLHGTTMVIADPHEIANVAGEDGIRYMLAASEGLPLTVYYMLPSCVPATGFDESGALLTAERLEPLYAHERVLGLGEVMSYPAVLAGDPLVLDKIAAARRHGCPVNGHAPLLSGKALDQYIAAGIYDDHECSSFEEAKERIQKGQWLMIRQGTAARNLEALLPLFDSPWSNRCLLVTDDKHPADLLQHGHIDDIIRQAVRAGKGVVTGIAMATLHAAQCFGLRELGAIAPGYEADLLVLDELDTMQVCEVYRRGKKVMENGRLTEAAEAMISAATKAAQPYEGMMRHSMHLAPLCEGDFLSGNSGRKHCRVIGLLDGQLLTEELRLTLDFDQDDGVDPERDLLKIAVFERHHMTGHHAVGYIRGTGLRRGAVASSVSHDSHNLVIIGADEADMALAGNRVRELGGGLVAACGGKVISELPLPIGGIMSDQSAEMVAQANEAVRDAVHTLGVPAGRELFMNMAFLCLPVISHLKITTRGLVDVDRQELLTTVCD